MQRICTEENCSDAAADFPQQHFASSGVASPKVVWGNQIDFRRATVLLVGMSLLKAQND